MKDKAEKEKEWKAANKKRKRETPEEREAREDREVKSFMSMANAIVQSRKDSRNRW